MKKLLSVISALAIILTPIAAYADASTAEPRPVQVERDGYIVPALQEPAGVDWVTGKGRKDWALRWAVDDNYIKKAPGMLLRGVSNTAFGWGDILTAPFRWSKNAPLGVGLVSGLIMGPIVATLRTVSGATDVATFWVPFWHGVPMKKQVLGLHEVAHYGTIEDVGEYDHATKRYFFSKLSEEY